MGGHWTMQNSTDDGALPDTIAIETEATRGEDFFHPYRDGTPWDNGNLSADGDGIDSPRFSRQGQDARGKTRKGFVGNGFV